MDIKEIYNHFLQSSGVSTDSRKIKANQLFIALSGENFNGNTFAEQALESGACLAIVDDTQHSQIEGCILVDNCLQTLQDLATYHRKKLNPPIIALTGSNGKTTTKELINAVLSQKFKTTCTQGNLNNHIGVPLTLLNITEATEIGIVEMGANHLKEIEKLCQIALPNYGYITNFGKAHLEGFGSEAGVIEGKTELYRHILKHKGMLFINKDDPTQVTKSRGIANYSFGTETTCDVNVSYPATQTFAEIQYANHCFTSQLTGQYNAVNIAAALCIGRYFNVGLHEMKQAIQEYLPSNNRSQIVKKANLNILLDAYNANPTSMDAALQNFAQMQAEYKIVILGDMFELGAATAYEHREVLQRALKQDYDAIIALGAHFKKVAATAPNLHYFDGVEDFQKNFPDSIIKLLKQPVLILIKGSRGMALERLVPFLEEQV